MRPVPIAAYRSDGPSGRIIWRMGKKLRCYLRRHHWEKKRGADNTTYYMCLDCGAIRDPQMRWGGGGEAPLPPGGGVVVT